MSPKPWKCGLGDQCVGQVLSVDEQTKDAWSYLPYGIFLLIFCYILMQGKKADKKETGDMLSNLDGSS